MAYGSNMSRFARGRLIRAAALIGLVGLLSATAGTLSPSPGSAATQASAGKVVPKHGGTVTVGESSVAVGLDPSTTLGSAAWDPIGLIYSGLLKWSPTNTVEPDLATSYDNPNPTTFIFHLRKGVKFQNGQPFTAADVTYTFDRILNPATASPLFGEYSVIDSVTAVNPYTVRFKLKHPSAPFLSALASIPDGMIVPQGVSNLVTNPVGTGPFEFSSYQQGQELVLKRNPNYYVKGLPYLNEVVIKYFGDQSSLVSAIRGGAVDMTWLSDPKVAAAAGARPAKPARHWAVWINLAKSPFNDVRVRRAMSVATNRQQIVDLTLGRTNAQVSGFIPPDEFGGDKNPVKDLHYYTYNPAEAKTLLAQAGHPNGVDLGTLDVDGTNQNDLHFAQILQQQWAAAGIKITVNPMLPADLLNAWHAGNFGLLGVSTKALPDPDVISEKVVSTNSIWGKAWGYSDTTLDGLVAAAASQLKPSKRVALYQKIQQRIADQAYAIVLMQYPSVYELWRNYVRGYKPSIFALHTGLVTTWRKR
jgi:peptide/nickel transport system substrate-binding protein